MPIEYRSPSHSDKQLGQLRFSVLRSFPFKFFRNFLQVLSSLILSKLPRTVYSGLRTMGHGPIKRISFTSMLKTKVSERDGGEAGRNCFWEAQPLSMAFFIESRKSDALVGAPSLGRWTMGVRVNSGFTRTSDGDITMAALWLFLWDF